MSRWLPERARSTAVVLGLDARQLARAWRDASGLDRVAVHDWRDNPAAAVRAALDGADAAGPAPGLRAVHLIAGGDLAFHWLQTPPAALASLAELHQVAQARCVHLYGPGNWLVTGDWQASHPFACAAISLGELAPLCQALQARRLALHWHTPWSLLSARAARAFPADGWSAARTPRQVLLWHCTAGQVDALTALPASPGEDAGATAARALQHMRIESSRTQHLAAGVLHWLDLAPAGPGRGTDDGAPAGTTPVRLALAHATAAAHASTESAAMLSLRGLLASSSPAGSAGLAPRPGGSS